MTNVVLGKKNTSGQRINFHIIFSDDEPPMISRPSSRVKGQGSVDRQPVLRREISAERGVGRFQEGFRAAARRQHLSRTVSSSGFHTTNTAESTTSTRRPTNCLKKDLSTMPIFSDPSNRSRPISSSGKTRQFHRGEYKAWFGKRKPCIKGSDSHNFNDEIGRLKDHNSKPTDRIAGSRPIQRLTDFSKSSTSLRIACLSARSRRSWSASRTTRRAFSREIRIGKTDDAETTDMWFDCDIAAESRHDRDHWQ